MIKNRKNFKKSIEKNEIVKFFKKVISIYYQ